MEEDEFAHPTSKRNFEEPVTSNEIATANRFEELYDQAKHEENDDVSVNRSNANK